MDAAAIEARPIRRKPLYHAVWRWHFYAGVLCVPFVIWLALTGSVYLWRPQLEALLDAPFDRLPVARVLASPDAQVKAALTAVPGSALREYILPQAPGAAVRVLVTEGGVDRRVYVDPRTLAVLHVATEEKRPFRILFRLHGELLAGTVGSVLVEIAACWAIVMLLTGLYLWWPVGQIGLGGLLYPRLFGGRRLLWRDLHATTGLWVSLLALGLILTGLPWAKVWGSYLTEVRAVTGTANGPVDWTIGGKAPTADAMSGDHAGHDARPRPTPPVRSGELARVIATARPLALAPPVLISPPKATGGPWSVASDAANRSLRGELKIDGVSGRLLSRKDFAQRHWIDRAIGYGIAMHEGALFGLFNQLLGTLTALMLVMLAVSGTVMWWRRRPAGGLGAPLALSRPRLGVALIGGIVALAISFPLFGATLLLVLAADPLLRRFGVVRRWLGLAAA